MHMIILSIHIFVATIMTGATLGVFVAARKERETKMYSAMLVSFALTIVSGVAMLFVSPNGLGRLCVMMTTFTLLVVVARSYYRKRVTAVPSL